MGLFSNLMGNASTVNNDDLTKNFEQLFIHDEKIELGFKLFRDTFIFTNKRLVIVDVQGLTGSKTEYLSVAYKSISRFSVETAGTFDLEAELKIWISSEAVPSIRKNSINL
ncbi:PH domain-containing protein [Pedobacter sp. SL55]|uniref:PH domain-containing protein n=1 Tax=Pedobacter sp. SL55 TaxID=2995161 RepID=UPI00226F5737|nr:PH domain-containing protein [Pedobacter sp. SL55]WAC41125.1 PH domain-containing protein [Pedobacter sp. SL55]